MKQRAWKLLWIAVVLGSFGGSVALVFAGDDVAPAPAVSLNAPGSGPVPQSGSSEFKGAPDSAHATEGCLSDASTLEDLRRQRSEIETRGRAIDAREAELKTREQALAEQLKGLAAARDEISRIEDTRKAESDTKVAKLVEAIEGMSPKAAAALLGALDEALAAASMTRLSTQKLSKILNVMDPTRSTRLSELLAGVVRAKSQHASAFQAAATTGSRMPANSAGGGEPEKGGESK